MVRAHEQDPARRLARAGGRRPWWVTHPVSRRPAHGLEWESSGSRAVVLVRGELDGRTALQLETFLSGRSLVGCRELEIDLAGVPSLGSLGLSALVGVRRWCLQRGIVLRLRGVQPSVWRVVELAGLGLAFTPPTTTPAAPAQELALFDPPTGR
jgi:anti-anti-sigma factor